MPACAARSAMREDGHAFVAHLVFEFFELLTFLSLLQGPGYGLAPVSTLQWMLVCVVAGEQLLSGMDLSTRIGVSGKDTQRTTV
jgi:hypothetical protein